VSAPPSGTATVRAFLAVPVPEAARAGIADACGRLGRCLPGVRFGSAEQVHVTLHFFAALDPDGVAGVQAAARAGASRVAPYRMGLAGAGAFPDPRRARVLWLGIRPGADETARLAAEVGAALRERGLPVEDRPFRAHVTLARLREPHPGVAAALDAGRAVTIDPFDVARLVLFRSELSPRGAVHTEIGSYPLGG